LVIVVISKGQRTKEQKMQLIDSHVHLNFDIFEPDGSRALTLARSRCGSFNTLSAFTQRIYQHSSLARFPELGFAVGLHPLDAEKWTKDTANQILALAVLTPRWWRLVKLD